MFYCDPCAEKFDWPKGTLRSRGKCEMCDTVADCNDVPSSALPLPKLPDPGVPLLIMGETGIDPEVARRIGMMRHDEPMVFHADEVETLTIRRPCAALAPCVLNAHAIASCQLDAGHDEGEDATMHEFVLKW